METIVLAILWAIASVVINALKKAREGQAEGGAVPATGDDGALFDLRPPEITASDLDHLEHRREGLLTELREGPGVNKVLVEVLEDRVGPSLRTANEGLEAGDSGVATERYHEAHHQIQVLSRLASLRAVEGQGAHLADAETLAEALIAPFAHLSATEQFQFAKQRPVAVPANPDEESIWFGLLPEGYPVIFVPRDFGQNLYRWASLPHELGHLVFREVPGFEDEMRDRLGLVGSGYLLRVDEEGGVNILEAFSAWLEEMVADAFAVMMMGPAGLRGLIESFASPDNPDAVLWAGTDGIRFAPHPPPHLRVLMAGKLLYHIGFDIEVAGLIDDWNERHGHPEQVFLPTMTGQALAIAVEPLSELGGRLLRSFHGGGYTSLAGRELRSIHGFELSQGEWARAQRHVPEFISGRPVRSDPKSVLIGGIEAFAQRPDAKDNIRRAVAAAVLGRDAGERLPVDRAYRPDKPSYGRRVSAADIQAAIVLREVFTRRF